MPFMAEVNSGTEWVLTDITKRVLALPELRKLSARERIRCQVCHTRMHVKAGVVMRRHFAHAPQAERDCIYDLEGGESEEHRAAKLEIVRYLSSLGEYKGAEIYYERYIPDVNNGNGRIADVYVEMPDGVAEVHEAQLSPITAAALVTRSDDYFGADLDVVWWLGPKANTPENRRTCLAKCGMAWIEFDMKEVSRAAQTAQR